MKIRFLLLVLGSLLVHQEVFATVYSRPSVLDQVIAEYPNEIAVTRADHDETLLDVARQFSLGQVEIVRLNPELDRWLIKKGQVVALPNKRILPDSPRQGITLNIAEYRMYYYPENSNKLYSFAHGVGRQDWKTPLGRTTIQKKIKDPVWRPPESIRREHAANGDPLPEVVPAGIHNPLGAYALYLNLPGDYRIHGTDIDKIYGIGMQITHGCVRMYPEDIEQLFQMVSEGTPVYIVKQPIKVGWLNNILYVESHPDLEGDETTVEQRLASALALIQKANNYELPDFDQAALTDALEKQTGNPVPIYERSAAEAASLSLPEPELPMIKPPVKPNAISTKVNLPVAKLASAKHLGNESAHKKSLPTSQATLTKPKSTQLDAAKKTSLNKQPTKLANKVMPASAAPIVKKPSPTGYYRGY